MQHSATTTIVAAGAVPVQPIPTIIAPQHHLNVSGTKGMGITQIVIGMISVGLGVGIMYTFGYNYWVSSVGCGIWTGTWIIITGILGVCTAAKPTSYGLIGTTMAFNIVSIIISTIVGIFYYAGFAFSVSCSHGYINRFEDYCVNSGNIGQALFASMMALMGLEFIIGLTAAIYCCGGCCRGHSPGVIIQQTPSQYQVVNSNHQSVMMQPTYGNQPYMPVQTSYPYATQQQYSQQMGSGQGPMYTAQASNNSTNVAYSSQSTHDKANLVDNMDVGDTGIPPPYSPY